jgi:hypothetical protein
LHEFGEAVQFWVYASHRDSYLDFQAEQLSSLGCTSDDIAVLRGEACIDIDENTGRDQASRKAREPPESA